MDFRHWPDLSKVPSALPVANFGRRRCLTPYKERPANSGRRQNLRHRGEEWRRSSSFYRTAGNAWKPKGRQSDSDRSCMSWPSRVSRGQRPITQPSLHPFHVEAPLASPFRPKRTTTTADDLQVRSRIPVQHTHADGMQRPVPADSTRDMTLQGFSPIYGSPPWPNDKGTEIIIIRMVSEGFGSS